MFSTLSVLCFSSKLVKDFPSSECHLRGTPSPFSLSQRCPKNLLPAGTCCPALPRACQAAAPTNSPPPGLISSCSLRTGLGPAFCKCEPESSGVTLLRGGSRRVMPPPSCFSGHLLPSISLCLTTKAGGVKPCRCKFGGGGQI